MMSKEKSRIYYKKYYARNKAKYRKAERKYRNTANGLEAYERAKQKFRENNPLYQKEYLKIFMKAKRKKAKQEGICIRCFKLPVKKDRRLCKKCLADANKRSKIYYREKKMKMSLKVSPKCSSKNINTENCVPVVMNGNERASAIQRTITKLSNIARGI